MKPFKTKAELAEYFGEELLTCLLCGKKRRALGTHLRRVHEKTVDEYKELFGIPWSYGLVCRATAESHSRALKKRIADGDESLTTAKPGEVRGRGKDLRKRCRAVLHESTARLAELNPRIHVSNDGTWSSEGLSLAAYRRKLERQRERNRKKITDNDNDKENGNESP